MSKHSSSHRRQRSATGRVRLIGGRLKRSQLDVIDSPGLRPTPDRVRETLFNWLSFDVPGKRVLDPFAGTGALAFEAISRGASDAWLIEQQPKVAALLEHNAERLKVADQLKVTKGDALALLAAPASYRAGLVFLDPPFHHGLASSAAQLLEHHGWLEDEALIYLECESSQPAQVPDNWTQLRCTQAGESMAFLYQRQPSS
ncbi:Ribosomal RNA small subunit methyltransferase D [Carnimonas sp. R-84981]|uniref:16S rRNA (guanine(966)-N(2))-methyltransferase RsmD n=1 Tax=Carnimonas bestiolae TaxID=3402172 RepID=UPI003EDB8A84